MLITVLTGRLHMKLVKCTFCRDANAQLTVHDLYVLCVSMAPADESAQLLTEKNRKTFSCLGARGVKP